jgi:hypothetical protein
VLAVLTGAGVDASVARDVGYGYAIGRRVDGLRCDPRALSLGLEEDIRDSGGRVVASLEELGELGWAVTAVGTVG